MLFSLKAFIAYSSKAVVKIMELDISTFSNMAKLR